jgi:hypothetical protein
LVILSEYLYNLFGAQGSFIDSRWQKGFIKTIGFPYRSPVSLSTIYQRATKPFYTGTQRYVIFVGVSVFFGDGILFAVMISKLNK